MTQKGLKYSSDLNVTNRLLTFRNGRHLDHDPGLSALPSPHSVGGQREGQLGINNHPQWFKPRRGPRHRAHAVSWGAKREEVWEFEHAVFPFSCASLRRPNEKAPPRLSTGEHKSGMLINLWKIGERARQWGGERNARSSSRMFWHSLHYTTCKC